MFTFIEMARSESTIFAFRQPPMQDARLWTYSQRRLQFPRNDWIFLHKI